MLNRIMCLLLLSCCLFGCKDDRIETQAADEAKREKFLQQTMSGVYDGDVPLLVFDEANHQMVFTADQKLWRIQTDGLDKYVHCELSEAPVLGNKVVVNVKAKGVNEVFGGQQEGLVLKKENDKCWLWAPDAGVGYLMQNNQ